MKRLLKQSLLGRFLLIPYRFWYATRYFARPWTRVFPWLFRSKEIGNFTYDWTENCIGTAAQFVAVVTEIPVERAQRYIRELLEDRALRDHIRRRCATSPAAAISDPEFRPAKRLMYYALVRALGPELVVEAGVDQGQGSCVIAAALLRNREEGRPGSLVACDVSPDAGHLLSEPYTSVAELQIADVRQVLAGLGRPVDLLIQDTAPQFEAAILTAAESHLAERAIVCSVWHTGDLLSFAQRTGRRFLVFHDEPKDHWYPGSHIAVAY